MAEAISVSLDDHVKEALDAECTEYGDNRSALIQEAIEEKLGLVDE